MAKQKVTLQFLGAANTVTGSRYLLSSDERKIMVDCGLFQGYKFLRQRNREPFEIPPASIDAVILTHAHLDHCGYLPALVKQGFKGPIFCTEATAELVKILLLDAAHLQEEEAIYLNKYHISKHQPALPLFTQQDAELAINGLVPRAVECEHEYQGTQFSFHRNGHILGSASVALKFEGRSLLFSGDLGRDHDPIMFAPKFDGTADHLIIESTYGNRDHDSDDYLQQFEDIITETAHKGGSVLIPAFAVGRAQLVLYILYQLRSKNRIPAMPVYLDSPMAINVTDVFRRFHDWHRLSDQQTEAVFRDVNYSRTVQQSMAINQVKVPKIIVSASGMATGGRVLHHLKLMLEDNRNSILFTGFQAGGTRGARMLEGETEVKIHGQYYRVRASVRNIQSLSAHADRGGLMNWMRQLRVAPKNIFITHGEPQAADALRIAIQEKLGWTAMAPGHKQIVEI